jgi:DNA helicase II / ATP-dependent DNA helicase PcrA
MKKLVLKKTTAELVKTAHYNINYAEELNSAQYEAVMHTHGSALVIAGAGTGKTRTLVYRTARLIEDGVHPSSILLLTFTRKSAVEMLRRASILLDGRCEQVRGGTFHSFAQSILRRHAQHIGFERNFTIADQSDAEDIIALLRSQKGLDSTKRRFPLKSVLHSIASSAINTCRTVASVVQEDYPQFVEELTDIEDIIRNYHRMKMKNNTMDYDDLLVYMADILYNHPSLAQEIRSSISHVMVDEYQDTNTLQHRIVRALAGEHENIMAVGDDAQSIYSFRGSNFMNIMEFPESFKDCRIIRIEENYRSTKPILSLTNNVIARSALRYDKTLFTTTKLIGDKPALISADSERTQSEFVVQQILSTRENGVRLNDIAVLFRSGFHSFDLEIELTKANIPFVKYGGMKFIETAHIKDVLAILKVILNPKDTIAWNRVLLLLEDVGPKTASLLISAIEEGKLTISSAEDFKFIQRGKESVTSLFKFLSQLLTNDSTLTTIISKTCEYYRPILKDKYEDSEKRWRDIEMLVQISTRYTSIENFLTEIMIDPPIQSIADITPESSEEEFVTLSTIHSAKGLEWELVFVINTLDGRFPSAKSVGSADKLEEERRLFYVALTRAKKYLYLTYPRNIFDRETGSVLAHPTRFLDGIDDEILDRYILTSENVEENPQETDLLLPAHNPDGIDK